MKDLVLENKADVYVHKRNFCQLMFDRPYLLCISLPFSYYIALIKLRL